LAPEDVAVLAADDDSLLCETCQPPLSAMSLTPEYVGIEAASLLDRLMRGGRVPKKPLLLEPSQVVERQSTQTLAMADKEIAQAVAFIRARASRPMQIADILREIAISRRQFERRFHAALGRSPATEIRRVHMDRAMRLLRGSEMPIPDVAAAAGFASREYMAQVFKQELGMSPLRYRLCKLAGRRKSLQ
jgi:LacI family transcriptional regulator